MPTIYEQMQEDKNVYDGVTLSYHGARFIYSSKEVVSEVNVEHTVTS